jgi:DNA-binding PadR family transcriptional regulator
MKRNRPSEWPVISAKEFLVLKLLEDGRKAYGLGLVRKSKGELKRGTIYVTLGRMKQKGYIRSELEPVGPGKSSPPRRMHSITPIGAKVLHIWQTAAQQWRAAVRRD